MILRAKHSLLLSALLGLSASAFAHDKAEVAGVTGYVIDSRGHVAKSGTNLCWRDGYWTPALAIAECDPDLVKKPEAPVAPVAAPAPAPKPAAEKVTLSADALFDFNKADLRPEGKAKLDKVAEGTKTMNVEVIIATGHADRFGSDAYNQKLSEKRAAAVKAYLVGKGVDEKRVFAEGKGETQPVTKPEDCKGAKSKKVIDCLQPDRRVDIEVIGTKTQ
ncbi:MAG TPA: OmpA family protein [Rugosibacter sp.]|nr:OmpA family protein [Rugosibacter sp.]